MKWQAWKCSPDKPGDKTWSSDFIEPKADEDDMALVSVKFADGDVKVLADLTVLDYKTHQENLEKMSAICYRSSLHSACCVT